MRAPVVQTEPYLVRGTGWHAAVYYGRVALTISHNADDETLSTAIAELIAKPQQRYWQVSFDRDSVDGEVWQIERMGQSILDDALGMRPALRLVEDL